MFARGPLRIAYFYEKPDNSTFRYRVYNMAQVLNHYGEISASYFYLEDLDKMDRVIEMLDVLVVCRTKYSHLVNELITRVKGRRKPVLFDVDDLVFNTDYTHLILNTLDQDLLHPDAWDFWFAYIGRIGATLRLCDGAITTNEFLAEQIRKFAGIPVSVVPNFLNKEQVSISNAVYDRKNTVGFRRDGRIHIGYFSGTPTHNKDFALVTDALAELLSTHRNAVLVVVGYMDISDQLKRLSGQVEYYPFQDFINLQRLVGRVEVNLMPLQSNVFTNCKSELKYFEAAVVGTLSVASPSFTYAGSIRDGGTGYVVKRNDWYEVLHKVIASFDNLHEIVLDARSDGMERYSWASQYSPLTRALFETMAH